MFRHGCLIRVYVGQSRVYPSQTLLHVLLRKISNRVLRDLSTRGAVCGFKKQTSIAATTLAFSALCQEANTCKCLQRKQKPGWSQRLEEGLQEKNPND